VSSHVERISKFFAESKMPLLFAGAGVSARAGIPIWPKLLSDLAEWLRAKDPLVANKIQNLLAKNEYLLAAEFFFLSDEVTSKEKYQILTDLLKPTGVTPLLDLCRLPFAGMVTTNFDRTLLDGVAAAKHFAPQDYRRGDASFNGASFATGFYVCRVHGFIENSSSIVLTGSQFEKLDQDDIYQDFLTHIFTRCNLLLIGFSFSDPAILNVLKSINRNFGPGGVGEHLALIPEDIDASTLGLLTRLNIETLKYPHEKGDFSHSSLWHLIFEAAKNLEKPKRPLSGKSDKITGPFETAKRYLASCFARANLGSQVGPLRAAILEGMVSAIVQKAAPKAVDTKKISEQIRVDAGIALRDAQLAVRESLKALAEEGLITWHKKENKVSWMDTTSDVSKLDEAIQTLVKSTIDRASVEEGYKSTSGVRKALTNFFTQLVLKRGWDLGAAFASGQIPNGSDIRTLMFQSAPAVATNDIEILVRVCERMIATATPKEAEILATLGRASFGLELALQAPRSHFFHATTLPARIYLDANVVMPAFIYGHTYHPVYKQTIESLKKACTDGRVTQVCTTFGYLNEIVSHRNLAIHDYESDPDGFKERAIREALFYGSANMNVFIGAYANLSSADKSLTFPEFLQKYAPFEREQQLQKWLERHGIIVINKRHVSSEKFASVSLELQKGYARIVSDKDARLLEHDAIQLAALAEDIQKGIRSVVVTADKRLREIVSDSRIRNLSTHMLSHVGLTQLIDLLVGQTDENRSLAHLLWDTKISRKSDEIRRYFVGLGLSHYDEAMAMELPTIVDQFADKVILEAKRRGIDTEKNASDDALLSIVGSFESEFFEAMRKKISLRQRQQASTRVPK
jgi:hypothetical protein